MKSLTAAVRDNARSAEVALFGCAFSLEDRTGDACADGGERDGCQSDGSAVAAHELGRPVIPRMRARAYRFAREVAPDVVANAATDA